MSKLNSIDDVILEQALRDPRVVSRAIYSDPVARDGKYFLILKEGQHFVFVVVFQHVNKAINPTGDGWSGGTRIEIPVAAFRWVLSRIDEHQAQFMSSRAGHRTAGGPVSSALKVGSSVTIKGEQLVLLRTGDDSGYVLENRSRCVHLPWANANWHQKLELTDRVLFEQGYWRVLKKLVARLPPAPIGTAKPHDALMCTDTG